MNKFGMLIDMTKPFCRGIFQGALACVQEKPHLQFATDPECPDFGKIMDCGGLIVGSIPPAWKNDILASDIPLVWVLSKNDFRYRPILLPDNPAIGRMAAQYLMRRGYRHFAYVTDCPGVEFSRDRFRGFADAVRNHGGTLRNYPERPENRPEGITEADMSGLQEWFEGCPHPLGVMLAHDPVARQVLDSLSRTDLRVPEDVALVGVDNHRTLCETLSPPLSSVAVPFERIGYKAVATLDQIMDGRAPERQRQLFQPIDVITRASSDTLAVNDPIVEEALEFIWQHATEKITVQQLADQVPMCRRSLERRFKSAFDLAPHRVIVHVRVEKAKRYLANTEWLMRQVAARSGFSGAIKLSSWFKKITGLTPTQYREQFRTP
jgi:LacI family transcriptional regulator